jgi:hypothetical protein
VSSPFIYDPTGRRPAAAADQVARVTRRRYAGSLCLRLSLPALRARRQLFMRTLRYATPIERRVINGYPHLYLLVSKLMPQYILINIVIYLNKYVSPNLSK